MKKTIILKILVFLLVGEAVVRFDQATLFFSGSRDQAIKNTRKSTPELRSIENGQFNPDSSQLRILLLGDSKLYGLGVNRDSTFSAQLKRNLLNQHITGFDSVLVLDVTLPGGNTYTNKHDFLQYDKDFKPQVLILGYNYNDVYGNQGDEPKTVNTSDISDQDTSSQDQNRKKSRAHAGKKTDDPFLEAAKLARKAIALSKMLDFVLVNLNMELKLAGIVLPGTEFHYLISKSHDPSFSGWQKSRKHLKDIAEICRERDIFLLVYITPSLEMLSNYQVYHGVKNALSGFCIKNDIICLDAIDGFLGRRSQDYAISRYDGHPNEAAHRIMAEQVGNYLTKRLQP